MSHYAYDAYVTEILGPADDLDAVDMALLASAAPPVAAPIPYVGELETFVFQEAGVGVIVGAALLAKAAVPVLNFVVKPVVKKVLAMLGVGGAAGAVTATLLTTNPQVIMWVAALWETKVAVYMRGQLLGVLEEVAFEMFVKSMRRSVRRHIRGRSM